MKKELILGLLVIFCAACNQEKNKNYSLQEHTIDIKPFIDLKKELDYTNRFALKIVGNERVLLNFSKAKKLLLFYLDKGTFATIPTNFQTTEIDAIKYNIANSDLIINKVLYQFNYANKSLDSIQPLPLSKNEFIIHNLYSENLFKYDDFYFIQLGDETGYNRLAKYGILFFNKDTNFNFVKTPLELQQEYIHYNDMCIDNIDDYFYYTYATTPFIHRANLKTQKDTSVQIPGSIYTHFDTTKLKDMKYIYDYTYQTTYNVKLLCSKNNIYLVQRTQIKEQPIFKVYRYTKDLQLISDFTLNHTVDPNFIFFLNEKLIFISLKDKKIYEYQFI